MPFSLPEAKLGHRKNEVVLHLLTLVNYYKSIRFLTAVVRASLGSHVDIWESQVLLTDGQVVFTRVLQFSPTFDERSARCKDIVLKGP